jgi:mitogen-activated protein kinase kinase kinase 5
VSSFYNADMVIVDFSLPVQKSTLSYHLGVRESFNMKHNILIYNDTDAEVTERLKVRLCDGKKIETIFFGVRY